VAVYIKFADGNERCYGDKVQLLGCTWAGDLSWRWARLYGLRSYVAPDSVAEVVDMSEQMPSEIRLVRVVSVEEVKVGHPENALT